MAGQEEEQNNNEINEKVSKIHFILFFFFL